MNSNDRLFVDKIFDGGVDVDGIFPSEGGWRVTGVVLLDLYFLENGAVSIFDESLPFSGRGRLLGFDGFFSFEGGAFVLSWGEVEED